MTPNQSLHLFSHSLNKNKVFVFDFDGTICNSYTAVVQIINDQSETFGYQKIQWQESAPMGNLTMQEALQSLGISKFKLPFFTKKIRHELNKEIDFLHPFPGITEALLHLKSKGYTIGILSSNSEENVLRFNRNNHLDIFDFIYSGSSLFGKDRVITKLLKNLDVPAKNAVYVGDETRDIEAAKKVGMPIIAVSWGYNSRSVLDTYHPDYLIDSVSELKEF